MDLLKKKWKLLGFLEIVHEQREKEEFSDLEKFQELFEVLFYETGDEVKEYVLTNRNLYNRLNPEYPEDLAFFKDGYCWLYSVTHEEIYHIYCENKKEYEYLKSIGIEFWEKEFVPTSKKDLYFENYK